MTTTDAQSSLLANIENKYECARGELMLVEGKLWTHRMSRWARWRLERKLKRLRGRIEFYERSMDRLNKLMEDE